MAVAGAAAAITTRASSVAKSVTDASTTSTFRVCAKPLNLSRYQGPPAFSRWRAFAIRGKNHQTRYTKIYLPALWVGLGYRSEEHTTELQSLLCNSYAVFCLKKQTY